MGADLRDSGGCVDIELGRMVEEKMTLYGVYGAGGSGRGIMPLARSELRARGLEAARLVFIDDAKAGTVVNGQDVISGQSFLTDKSTEKFAAIAIANSRIRSQLDAELVAAGVKPWTLIAENVIIMDDTIIGEGALISPFVTLTSNIRIGRQFHANLYSQVEHDCVVGDFVTLAPGARVNGNIVLEDHVYVGSNAVIRHGLQGAPVVIGKGAVIGMGAVVTRSVAPGTTVVGNPARPMRR
jgi:sugar O-acyltransferase (sialic acid O-acetyltransferase NeuD family)